MHAHSQKAVRGVKETLHAVGSPVVALMGQGCGGGMYVGGSNGGGGGGKGGGGGG